ncbi:hypothetical protein PNH38_05235 [Anoxybacillus rupiensis]|jgi:hypothetical protein|uniref:Uncharacterized protein n=1 Tax=Anoxybacteroides rupiense TaxID=311460 RepID=A0ABT5W3B2_9BACL|nr:MULTISPECIES: hypothetical protein [Anoxybacillus]MDE8563289.1 hypothetical protein [Anoxybacillus rupiensis]QHC03841.1 hypothetical protein GRQ40_07535 [Anoxybacillus sp. PDR2]
MKRLVSTILSVGLAVSGLLATDTHAATEQFKEKKYRVVEKNKEVTDLNILFENAKRGKSDLNEKQLQKLASKAELKADDKEPNSLNLNVETFETSQLLETREYEDGSVEKDYAITTFAIANEPTNTLSTVSDEGGSQNRYKWDSTLGVKAYSTVYYSIVSDPRGSKHWDITSVSGGWQIEDNTYILSGMKVVIGQNGWSYWGGIVTAQSVTKYPSSRTYSYTAPSSWVPVVASGSFTPTGSGVGMNSTVTIKRDSAHNTSSWTLSLTNNLGS